jgi:hypothetical protein
MQQNRPDPSTSAYWTPALGRRFLDHLARHANVRAAAKACGLSRQSAYKLRRRDPRFARAWDEALAAFRQAGEAELARLVGHLLQGAAAVDERRNSALWTAST